MHSACELNVFDNRSKFLDTMLPQAKRESKASRRWDRMQACWGLQNKWRNCAIEEDDEHCVDESDLDCRLQKKLKILALLAAIAAKLNLFLVGTWQ